MLSIAQCNADVLDLKIVMNKGRFHLLGYPENWLVAPNLTFVMTFLKWSIHSKIARDKKHMQDCQTQSGLAISNSMH